VFAFRLDARSGVPTYLQLVGQVKQAVLLGYLQPGDQLPTVREVAADLAINPNTVAKAYRELQHEGVLELRHGSGAFVARNPRAGQMADTLRAAQSLVAGTVERLRARDVSDEEIRRLFGAELARRRRSGGRRA